MANSTVQGAAAHDDPLVALTEGGLELELGEMETLSVKTLLEANEIPVVVQGASQMPNLPYEILVPRSQLEAALGVIRAALEAGAETPAE